MLREPAVTARWLLIVYAAGVLALVGVPAFLAWADGEADMILWSLPIFAWIAGPAALAARLVVRDQSRVEAWLFVGAEVAVIASTVWLCITLYLDRGHQNAQSGVAILFLPLAQLALLLSYASGVIGTALIVRRRSARV